VLDKIFAAYVAIFFLIVPMVAIAVLSTASLSPILGTILLGLSIGAEFDLMAYIISRYFGVKAFGALYGLITLFVNLANASGASLMGWCFQLKHSYTPIFGVFEIMLVVAIILMSRLGPYRFPAPRKEPKKVAEAVGAAQ
jgi:sugar phosphate permease